MIILDSPRVEILGLYYVKSLAVMKGIHNIMKKIIICQTLMQLYLMSVKYILIRE